MMLQSSFRRWEQFPWLFRVFVCICKKRHKISFVQMIPKFIKHVLVVIRIIKNCFFFRLTICFNHIVGHIPSTSKKHCDTFCFTDYFFVMLKSLATATLVTPRREGGGRSNFVCMKIFWSRYPSRSHHFLDLELLHRVAGRQKTAKFSSRTRLCNHNCPSWFMMIF